MKIKIKVNNTLIQEEVASDLLLIDFLRSHGCYSVKRGCETANCGLCTVWMDQKPVLSCSLLCVKCDGREITTLEGVEQEAATFARYMAQEGAEQCGYCSPGLIMNVLAMKRELKKPSMQQIKEYLSGNLCRCTGYMGQLRAVSKYLSNMEVDK